MHETNCKISATTGQSPGNDKVLIWKFSLLKINQSEGTKVRFLQLIGKTKSSSGCLALCKLDAYF
jgi:hypothetical protein